MMEVFDVPEKNVYKQVTSFLKLYFIYLLLLLLFLFYCYLYTLLGCEVKVALRLFRQEFAREIWLAFKGFGNNFFYG